MSNEPYLKYNPLFLGGVYRHYQKLHSALTHCHLIAISNYVQELLFTQGIQSTVIPNALSLLPLSGIDQEKPEITITYLGSLTHFKGPHLLLEALKGLPYRCEIYGNGPLKEKLERYILEQRINATIHEPVSFNDVQIIYEKADIIVVPSLWPEPFGRIPIEAMAYGKAVIGSNIGGIKETIAEDRGRLFTPGNAEELRQKIIELAGNKELRQHLGQQGRAFVEENFQERLIAQKVLQCYETARNTSS